MPKINGQDNNHPIAHAVEPLRAMAIERATIHANEFVASVRAKLELHAWDFDKAYSYPDRMSRMQYLIAQDDCQNARMLVKRIGAVSYMPRAPHIVEMDAEGVARFVKLRCDMAEATYEAFAIKLIGKVGACDTATLNDKYVWSDSILTVCKGAAIERWHTAMIANRSKLGKWFNQWPTRIMRPAKTSRKAG